MTTLLFYKNVVALDREQHKSLKIKPATELNFAAEASTLPLVSGEFVEASRSYPIAFLRADGGAILPVALVGLPGGKNLFLTEDGLWDAPYIPAFVRRYPFVFAETADDQLTLCIDRDYEGFDEEEGASLFAADGEPDAPVKGALELLSEFQRQHLLTQQFIERLDAAGLLMEASASANLNDGRNLTLQGLLVVDEQKFRALPEATLTEWFRSGDIGLVYAHLLSLGNLLALLRRQPAVTE